MKKNIEVNGHIWTFEIDGINNSFSGQASIEKPCFSGKEYTDLSSLFETEESVIDYLTEKIISKNYTYSHPTGPGQKTGSTCRLCKRQIQDGEVIFGSRE